MVENTQNNDPGQSRHTEAATQETTTAAPPPTGGDGSNQPDPSDFPDPISNILLPENALPRLDPIWATLLNPAPEVPNMQQDTPMHDPSDALSLVMQLCAAGMDLGDVTRLGAELGVAEPANPEPADGPQLRDLKPTREPQPHHPRPVQKPSRPRAPTKRNAPSAVPNPTNWDAADLTDVDVDLAHADHPGEAAVHVSEEGNETPLRIQVCRPVGIKVPTSLPTPTTYEVLALRVATLRHIPAALQEHWSRTQAGILNAFCSEPSEILLWGLVAMPKLVLRVTKTRGKNAAAHQQDLIRSRLQQFEQGEWQAMWTTLKTEASMPEGPETRSAKRARVDVHAANSAAVRRAQKCLAEGSPGKALQQLTSPGLHDPHDPAVWEKLKQLHPRGPPLLPDSLPADISLDLGDQDIQSFWEPLVKDAITSFPRSSAPGPSGLRA